MASLHLLSPSYLPFISLLSPFYLAYISFFLIFFGCGWIAMIGRQGGINYELLYPPIESTLYKVRLNCPFLLLCSKKNGRNLAAHGHLPNRTFQCRRPTGGRKRRRPWPPRYSFILVGTSHEWPFRPHLSFRAEREILPDANGQDFSVASLLRNDKGGNHSDYYKKPSMA